MTLANIFKEQVLGLFSNNTRILNIDTADLYTDEAHTIEVRKTVHPVETGSSISDNVVVMPQRLKMKGYVSNLAPVIPGLLSISSSERGRAAWKILEDLANKRELVDIDTVLTRHVGFLITNVQALSTDQTGSALEFIIEFEEFLFADSQSTTLSAFNLADNIRNKAGQIEAGIKQAIQVPASVAVRIINKITSFFGG